MDSTKSETWDIRQGGVVPLGRFFIKGFNYRSTITDYISEKISDDLKNTADSVYYKNSPERCKRFFNEKRYYLSDEGFVFYYPSYSIAPYCEGIQTFEMPFALFGEKLKYIPDRIT